MKIVSFLTACLIALACLVAPAQADSGRAVVIRNGGHHGGGYGYGYSYAPAAQLQTYQAQTYYAAPVAVQQPPIVSYVAPAAVVQTYAQPAYALATYAVAPAYAAAPCYAGAPAYSSSFSSYGYGHRTSGHRTFRSR